MTQWTIYVIIYKIYFRGRAVPMDFFLRFGPGFNMFNWSRGAYEVDHELVDRGTLSPFGTGLTHGATQECTQAQGTCKLHKSYKQSIDSHGQKKGFSAAFQQFSTAMALPTHSLERERHMKKKRQVETYNASNMFTLFLIFRE